MKPFIQSYKFWSLLFVETSSIKSFDSTWPEEARADAFSASSSGEMLEALAFAAPLPLPLPLLAGSAFGGGGAVFLEPRGAMLIHKMLPVKLQVKASLIPNGTPSLDSKSLDIQLYIIIPIHFRSAQECIEPHLIF